MQKANEKSNPSEQEPAEEGGRVSSVKAQSLGTTPPQQNSELAGHLGSLMSALDSEQSQWEKENPPEDFNLERFAEAIKLWPRRKTASSNPPESSLLPPAEQAPDR